MLDLLIRPLPSSVEVGGEEVPLRTGFRSNVLAETMDPERPEDRLSLLYLWYGDPPQAVVSDPVAALGAASDWHAAAWRLAPYGSGRGQARARVWDWDADACIVVSDFQRLYGIDLTSPDTQMHWYRFCALLLGAMRTEGSLTGAAVSARSPIPTKARGEERKRLIELKRAWALPPTEDERREMARRRF